MLFGFEEGGDSASCPICINFIAIMHAIARLIYQSTSFLSSHYDTEKKIHLLVFFLPRKGALL
jgi:hypothetical protein